MTVKEVMKVVKSDFIYLGVGNSCCSVQTPTDYHYDVVEKYGSFEVDLIEPFANNYLLIKVKGV